MHRNATANAWLREFSMRWWKDAVPATNQVAARRGEEAMTSYLFGLHDRPHHSSPDLHYDKYSSVGAFILRGPECHVTTTHMELPRSNMS